MIEQRPVYLGIDIGTESVKIVGVDRNGTVVASVQKHYTFDTPRPGWTECHPDVWWFACLEALLQLGKQIVMSEVAGIGITGQMHSTVLLDDKGEPVATALLWNDQRTASALEEIETKVTRGRIQRITGNRMATGFSAPKLAWWRHHHPEVYTRIQVVMMPKDYVVYRMTGHIGTDVTDASGTGVFNVPDRKWADDLIQELGFSIDYFPHAFESQQVVGAILSDIAQRTGLLQGTPVIAGAADNAASAIGADCTAHTHGMISIGTSGVVLAPIAPQASTKLSNEIDSLHLFCHALPNMWYCMGVTLSAGYSLQWLQRLFASLGSEATEPVSLSGMSALAEGVEAGAEGLYFLPYLNGERTPILSPNAKGVFFGLAAKHEGKHLIRAVMEGVAYSLKDSFELMTQMGTDPQVLNLTGGVVKSQTWSQIVCDVLGLPLQLHSQSGAAEGIAKLCVHALTDIPLDRFKTEPYETLYPWSSERYDTNFQRYQSIANTLLSLWT